MLIGGWSNSISVTGPRVRTWRRSSLTAPLPLEQPSDRTFERDARVRALFRGEEVHGGDRADEPGDGIRDRRAGQAGRVVARGPAPVGFGARAVPGAVGVGERTDPQH